MPCSFGNLSPSCGDKRPLPGARTRAGPGAARVSASVSPISGPAGDRFLGPRPGTSRLGSSSVAAPRPPPPLPGLAALVRRTRPARRCSLRKDGALSPGDAARQRALPAGSPQGYQGPARFGGCTRGDPTPAPHGRRCAGSSAFAAGSLLSWESTPHLGLHSCFPRTPVMYRVGLALGRAHGDGTGRGEGDTACWGKPWAAGAGGEEALWAPLSH